MIPMIPAPTALALMSPKQGRSRFFTTIMMSMPTNCFDASYSELSADEPNNRHLRSALTGSKTAGRTSPSHNYLLPPQVPQRSLSATLPPSPCSWSTTRLPLTDRALGTQTPEGLSRLSQGQRAQSPPSSMWAPRQQSCRIWRVRKALKVIRLPRRQRLR